MNDGQPQNYRQKTLELCSITHKKHHNNKI